MKQWFKWPRVLFSFFFLWIASAFVAPVFFYMSLGARRESDFVYYQVVVIYECKNHKNFRTRKMYAGEGSTISCGLPNVPLVFHDRFGFEVYRGITDKDGELLRPFSFEGYEGFARAKSIVLQSEFCKQKKYPFEVEKELVRTGEWFTNTIRYRFSGYKIIDCELTSEGKKILEEK